MKKVIVLTLVAIFALGMAVSAEEASCVLSPGFNLIAPPLVPIDPYPENVFSGINIEGRLSRYNPITTSMIDFSPWTPEEYGGVLLGDGAWLYVDSEVTWTYEGLPNGVPDLNNVKTDMWVSLPKAGATLIGHPFKDDVELVNCLVTDGTATKSWDDAVAAGWVAPLLTGYDAPSMSYYDVGTDFIYVQVLQAYHGYWVYSNKDNLAMIIPAVQ